MAEEGKKRIVFLLKSGLNNPGLARAGLMFASISASMDVETILYCIQDGSDVLVKGVPEKERVEPGKPSIKQRLQDAIDAGVKFELCEATARLKGIKQEDLIPEARIVGAARLIDLTLDSDGVLCY